MKECHKNFENMAEIFIFKNVQKILKIFRRKIWKCARLFFKKYSPNILKICVRNLEMCLKYIKNDQKF
jgi:hypothetical protein